MKKIVVVVQSSNCVWLFAALWTAALQTSLSFTISQILLNLVSIESVMPSNHLSFCYLVSSCPQSFPASESFPLSLFQSFLLFASGGQSIGASASASVLPMNIQGWFPWIFKIDSFNLLAVQEMLIYSKKKKKKKKKNPPQFTIK